MNTISANHSFYNSIRFRLISSILILKRQYLNRFEKPAARSTHHTLAGAPVISESESMLRNPDDNKANRILTAGKIQNLRVAGQKLNGIELKAGELFSFWSLVGKPIRSRGFVQGREIREGCLVATIGGGLCQLSNALYDAALKAGFEIVERHRHSQVVKGSLAEINRDATVKWNYIDLRFKSDSDFRIEVSMDPDRLRVVFKSAYTHGNYVENMPMPGKDAGKLNDCYSCGNATCHMNKMPKPGCAETGRIGLLLDELWPEHEKYLREQRHSSDFILLPYRPAMPGNRKRNTPDHIEMAPSAKIIFPSLRRYIEMRMAKSTGKNIFSASLNGDKRLAKAMAKKIPLTADHLIISQNILPFLYSEGVLGGRTYDVLMTRLPFRQLHERLDLAWAKYPQSETLHDFRAPEELVQKEEEALRQARYIVSPHTEIISLFASQAMPLNWLIPTAQPETAGNKILFPASALARKGAYEMRQLAEELHLDLIVSGKSMEMSDFWGDVRSDFAGVAPLKAAGMLIYPAYVEHQPRLVLRALAAGLPVIASRACGLPALENLTLVETGDYEALKKATLKILNLRKSATAPTLPVSHF